MNDFNGALPVISSRKYDPVQVYDNVLLYDLDDSPNNESRIQAQRIISKNPSTELYAVSRDIYADIGVPVYPLLTLDTPIDNLYEIVDSSSRIGFTAGKPTRLDRLMLNRINLLRTQFPNKEWTAIGIASHEVGFFSFCRIVVDSLWYNLEPKKKVAINVNGTVRLQPFHKSKNYLLKYELENWHKNNVIKLSYLEIAESRNFDMTGYYVNSMGITVDMVNYLRQGISERRT